MKHTRCIVSGKFRLPCCIVPGSDKARQRNRLSFETNLLVCVLEVELGAVLVRGEAMADLVHVRDEARGMVFSLRGLRLTTKQACKRLCLETANIEQADSSAAGDQKPNSTNLRRCAVH